MLHSPNNSIQLSRCTCLAAIGAALLATGARHATVQAVVHGVQGLRGVGGIHMEAGDHCSHAQKRAPTHTLPAAPTLPPPTHSPPTPAGFRWVGSKQQARCTCTCTRGQASTCNHHNRQHVPGSRWSSTAGHWGTTRRSAGSCHWCSGPVRGGMPMAARGRDWRHGLSGQHCTLPAAPTSRLPTHSPAFAYHTASRRTAVLAHGASITTCQAVLVCACTD